MPLDFSKPFTTHCSVTIRTQVVEIIDKIVARERELQPKIAKKITRSSVMSLLLANHLELTDEAQSNSDGIRTDQQLARSVRTLAAQMESLNEE